MTTDLITNIGKEYYTEDLATADSHDYGLYLDATDAFSESNDIGDETTEPTNTNYARQTSAVTIRQNAPDYGYDNDSQLQFDFSDQSSSQNVDALLDIHSYQSDTVNGDGSAVDHLICNPALSQTRDIGAIDTLTIAAGDANLDLGN